MRDTVRNKIYYLYHAAVGLLTGIILYGIYLYAISKTENITFSVTMFYFTVVSALILGFVGTNVSKRLRFYAASVFIALGFSIFAFLVWSQLELGKGQYQGDDFRAATFATASVFSLYIILPYLRIYSESGKLSFPYAELFRHSWNDFFIIMLASAFAGIFYGLISLWAVLFKTIGISFFADIFFTAPFGIISVTTAFFAGLAIGKANEKITIMQRNTTLMIFKTLLPLLSVISVLFLVALPFTGLGPLWKTGYSSYLTLGLFVVGIVFINAVFMDGEATVGYPRWFLMLTDAMLLTLPVYALITIYSMWLRIEQYGLTPERTYAMTFALIGLLYGIGYSIAVFRKAEIWLGMARMVNIAMSFVIVLAAFLLHSPLLDVFSLSAWNQHERLMTGRVDAEKFDYAALRFKLGHYGYERLNALEKDAAVSNHPKASTIRLMVSETMKMNGYWNKRRFEDVAAPLREEDIRIFTSAGKLPEGLLDAMKDKVMNAVCRKEKNCAVYEADIDSDPEYEYLFITSCSFPDVLLFDRDGAGAWLYAGRFSVENGVCQKQETLIEALNSGAFKPVRQRYMDIEIAGKRYIYQKN